jgi:hypothetical protein
MSRFVDALITYRILRLLTTPFDQQDAFRLGLIDKHGNRLKKENELNTTEEQEAYSLLHRMVFRLKRIIEKVPMDNKNFLSFATAVALVREGIEYDDEILEEVFYMTQERQDVKDLAEELESGKIQSFKQFVEEMGVAGGGVAGIGIPHPTKANQAEPGLTKSQQKKYKKKNKAGVPATLIRRK